MSCENQREQAITEAKGAGLVVVFGDPSTLQLDIDSEEDFRYAKAALKSFRDILKFSNVTVTISKGGRKHLYVNLKTPIPDRATRYALQAFLGSDRKREFLNWDYQRQYYTGECFFFEKEAVEYVLLKV